jgi:hypothetical protein
MKRLGGDGFDTVNVGDEEDEKGIRTDTQNRVVSVKSLHTITFDKRSSQPWMLIEHRCHM